jgi:photosystem II stability/assembly factor-like uncharacterized protein
MPKGPTGINVNEIFVGKTTGNVFIGSEGGVYGSGDGGVTWEYRGLRFRPIDVIAAQCGSLYAGAWSEVFLYSGGTAWNPVANSGGADVNAIILDGTCTVGFIGTDSGVLGANYTSGLVGLEVSSLAKDSNNDIYAGTMGAGVFKTTNLGTTWLQMNNGLENLGVWSINIDGNDTIFAGTFGGVYVSTDGGSSWNAKNGGLPEGVAFDIVRSSAGDLYASVTDKAFNSSVYKSSNDGDLWSKTSLVTDFLVQPLAVDNAGGAVYAGVSGGDVYKSLDGGSTWQNMTADKVAALSFSNSFARGAANNLYIGSRSGVYKSADEGNTWTKLASLPGGGIGSLVFDKEGNFYAATSNISGVYKSADGGSTWNPAVNGLPTTSFFGFDMIDEVQSLVADGNGNIYAGMNNGAVYKSSNKGADWSPTAFFTNSDIRALLIDANDNIYAGTEDEGVFKSTDGGATWIQKNTGILQATINAKALYFDSPAGDLYAGTGGGLYRTSNGGDSWQNIQVGPWPQSNVESIIKDNSGNLYVIANDSVQASANGGASWVDMNVGITVGDNVEGLNLSGLALANDNKLILATESSSMYKQVSFIDVPFTFWAYRFIEQLSYAGITGGCGSDNFCPDNPVTRSQMAVFLLKAMGETPASSCTNKFGDVDETTGGNPAFCKYIEKFSTLGITAGCGNNNFCPNDPISRTQMAVFITKALNETTADTCSGSFNDVDDTTGGNAAFCKYIEKFSTLGITAGCGNGNFCPDLAVTRDQMAVFLTKGFLQ